MSASYSGRVTLGKVESTISKPNLDRESENGGGMRAAVFAATLSLLAGNVLAIEFCMK